MKVALASRSVESVQDQAGLIHVTIPLSLGPHNLGAIIAGQVFDQYPEPLRLQRLARKLGISAQRFCNEARLQVPVRRATIRVYADLLQGLGTAFVQQRYGVILARGKLATANLRHHLLLDGTVGHALFTLNDMGLVTNWNLAAERIFGYTESDMMGRDFSCLFTPEQIQAGIPGKLMQKAHQEGSTSDHGYQVRKDGTRFYAGKLAFDAREGPFTRTRSADPRYY